MVCASVRDDNPQYVLAHGLSPIQSHKQHNTSMQSQAVYFELFAVKHWNLDKGAIKANISFA